MIKKNLAKAGIRMSCGKGIPVYKLRIDYGEEAPLVLMIEKRKECPQVYGADK